MRYNKKQKNNKTGKSGVSWNKNAGKYEAYIWKDRRKYALGLHAKFEDAVRAREKAEKRFIAEVEW
jgi:hypothetical protein